jgi:hypothetical protein
MLKAEQCYKKQFDYHTQKGGTNGGYPMHFVPFLVFTEKPIDSMEAICFNLDTILHFTKKRLPLYNNVRRRSKTMANFIWTGL